MGLDFLDAVIALWSRVDDPLPLKDQLDFAYNGLRPEYHQKTAWMHLLHDVFRVQPAGKRRRESVRAGPELIYRDVSGPMIGVEAKMSNEPLPDIFNIDIEPCGPVNQSSDASSSPGCNVKPPTIIDEDLLRQRQRCGVCGVEGKLWRCLGCKNAFYCSREHQKAGWPIHQWICVPIEERERIFFEVADEVCPMQSEGNDVRPFIDIRIGERAIKALLDTGSTMTCVREVDELNWVYGCGARVRPAPRNSAAVADGSMMSVQSLITLPLAINDEIMPIEVRVIPKLKYEMILGMDAIIAFGICYDGGSERW
ncbi:hypothetical protein KQX54_011248 [Cotesia glomerata]|uniref:MYND-type domain-containing protein n=1 Tax=Cotesia glomerata TaxID=32391 RepID=A0AAV7HTM4_COTGL|nr:hypothetical protein KQX54_011248 [Cotesia glomerata]